MYLGFFWFFFGSFRFFGFLVLYCVLQRDMLALLAFLLKPRVFVQQMHTTHLLHVVRFRGICAAFVGLSDCFLSLKHCVLLIGFVVLLRERHGLQCRALCGDLGILYMLSGCFGVY